MIQIENLTKQYGAVRAIDNLTMTVEPGSIFGFLGPNGAGKTTTLRILTGLAKPTSGSAQVAGVNLSTDARNLPRHIGFLPEEPVFYPWMTPREFLDYIGRLHGLSISDRAARVKELLELVNLTDAGKRRIGGFSRGMRQRLGLAAALVHRPEVLLLDEPVSALDPAGRKDVLELIEQLSGQCTILMSTHILADVERVCNMVGIITRGRLIVQSPREELLNRYVQPVFELDSDDVPSIQRWAELLKKQTWITSVNIDGNITRIVVNDLVQARKELLASAMSQQIVPRRYEEMRLSLEDVFLQLVEKESVQ
ncbi:MAG: ABC transporter ATP-binding protein [Chloroflexi bacterium]|nr:ABC transporter ATP-binding protein [Chloroflexota bacterium]